MSNETLSKIIGAAVGAALIIAGMAVFGPRTTTTVLDSGTKPALSRVASLHASETVTVVSRN